MYTYGSDAVSIVEYWGIGGDSKLLVMTIE